MGKTYKDNGDKTSGKPSKKGQKKNAAPKPQKVKEARPVRHHGDEGVPNYTPDAKKKQEEASLLKANGSPPQLADTKKLPASDVVIEGGILKLTALHRDFPGTAKFFEVAGEKGDKAVFRAWKNTFEKKHDDGTKESIPYIAVNFYQKPVGGDSTLRSIPESAMGIISISQGQIKKGKEFVTRPERMDDRTYAHKLVIWSFLNSAYERALAEETEARKRDLEYVKREETEERRLREERRAGIAKLKAAKAAVKMLPPIPISKDIGAFASGFGGRYNLAGAHVHVVERKGKKKPFWTAEILLVPKNHELYGKCRSGTFIPHIFLSRTEAPEFKGYCAADSVALWEYLTGVIAKHRAEEQAKEVVVGPDVDTEHIRAPQFGHLPTQPVQQQASV